MTRSEKAAEFFLSGYHCAQSVAMAFAKELGMEEKAAAKIASGFGGGFGRQREVCGAVSGMVMVASYLYGYDTPDQEQQAACYQMVQSLCKQFAEQNGSIICRDILKNPPSDPTPSPRTAEYYAQRPCARMVMSATEILENYISKNPL